MAIVINTPTPKALLTGIKKAIDDHHIDTWTYDKNAQHSFFTHKPGQWINKAYFYPYISAGILQFGLFAPAKTKITQEIYSIYHGRFIEMLLAHFGELFSTASATSQKVEKIDNFEI